MRVRTRALAALDRLLPRCGAAEYAGMDPHQRLCLFQLLAAKPHRTVPDLPAEIAGFLGECGDAEALPYLRRAARQRGDRDLAETARAAVEAIVEREKAVAAPDRLLRPARAAGDGALLRPAGVGEEADEAVLLRATGNDA
jgi:hypothetical protein